MESSLDLLKTTLLTLPADAAYIVLVLALLFVAQALKDLLTPYKLDEELTTKDNAAVGLSVAGYYLGVLIVCLGPLLTSSGADPLPLVPSLLSTGGYGLLGILLLNVSRVVVGRFLLTRFSLVKEIVEDRNTGTGAVEMGTYIASALVVAATLHGRGGGPHTTVAFFALGELLLVAYGHIYMKVCSYDVHAEIERDNVAAGVALGFNLIAMGVVLTGGIAGDFTGWTYDIARLVIFGVLGMGLLLALRWLVDLLLLRGVRIDKEILEDKNVNVAWIEGAVLSGIAAVLVAIL